MPAWAAAGRLEWMALHVKIKTWLQDALERGKLAHVYVPLGVHLFSGSIFFLAGKGVYEDRYRHSDYIKNKRLKELYRNAEGIYCYDYLRLVSGFRKELWVLGKGLRMQPAFHKNVGKSYDAVLEGFKAYCSEERLENNKPELFRLLDEHLDWEEIIPARFYSAFYRHLGRKRDYELESFLRALFLQRIFHYVDDSQLLNTLRFSYEMRDCCGFR